MKAGEKVLAEKMRELDKMYKRHVDPYAVLFWISVVLMVGALVLGVVVGFM